MAGRKPVHLTSSAGKVGGRQAMWEAMRKRKRFTLSELANDINAARAAVRDYASSMVKAGILVVDGQTPAPTGVFGVKPTDRNMSDVFKLVHDCGIEAPRLRKDGSPCTQGLPREQMWRTMNMSATFTARDLAATASTDTVTIKLTDAKDYLKHLQNAGYLAVVKPGKPGHKPGTGSLTVYRLIKKTGPRPPMVQRMKTVFDPNLGVIMWHEEVDA
ncbi:MAG: hypothetical protein E6R08_04080 [Nevskiaceae bacterium]|nr:MAG: hypothetical protein E6R08_04080 [Nevskiaceae bacterium]